MRDQDCQTACLDDGIALSMSECCKLTIRTGHDRAVSIWYLEMKTWLGYYLLVTIKRATIKYCAAIKGQSGVRATTLRSARRGP